VVTTSTTTVVLCGGTVKQLATLVVVQFEIHG